MPAYQRIFDAMEKEMEAGLKRNTHETSTIKMYPSYVTQLPNGISFASPFSALRFELVYSLNPWFLLSVTRLWRGAAPRTRPRRHQFQSTPRHPRTQQTARNRLRDLQDLRGTHAGPRIAGVSQLFVDGSLVQVRVSYFNVLINHPLSSLTRLTCNTIGAARISLISSKVHLVTA